MENDLDDLRQTVESMERTLMSFVDDKSINKDNIEDFMSYTTSALSIVSSTLDRIREQSTKE